MRVTNPETTNELHLDLRADLRAQRERRSFDAASYVDEKASILNAYLNAFGLNSCVVAVSGGIDSAVGAAITVAARDQPGSPIERIVAVTLPVHDPIGATNQDITVTRSNDLAETFDLDLVTIDLTAAHAALRSTVDGALGLVGQGWASGQAVSYQRTPTLYYVTSLLTEAGLGAVLCGTTNRDEGAYLGYFGKASDGMVDMQIISDLHKSEVAAVAAHLGVPASIREAEPTGDMFDARSDVEVFGAPYDFVELYLGWLTLDVADRAALRDAWSPAAAAQFDEMAGHLEHLHTYNGHKYLGHSPAVHLDILEATVPGGWTYFNWSPT